MLDIMQTVGNFKSIDEMLDHCHPQYGFKKDLTAKINQAYKNARADCTHVNQHKKFRALGPASNVYTFSFEGSTVTVEKYFEIMHGRDRRYPILKYPQLPTVEFGRKDKPMLVPAELVWVPEGQTRKNSVCFLLLS